MTAGIKQQHPHYWTVNIRSRMLPLLLAVVSTRSHWST